MQKGCTCSEEHPSPAVCWRALQPAFFLYVLSWFPMTAALLAASVPSGPILSSEWLLNSAEVVFDATRPFGSGAFAQVFRGRYRGQDVAVKVIHQNLLDNEERCVAFGRTTAQAGTRNVVTGEGERERARNHPPPEYYTYTILDEVHRTFTKTRSGHDGQ